MTSSARSIARKASLGAIAVAALVFAGCAAPAASSTPAAAQTTAATPEPTTAEPIELEISWWGNEERAALFGQVIDGFVAANPTIKVTGTPVGSPDDLFNRLATDFAGGGSTAPDVFALGGAKPQEYGEAGALLDLATVADIAQIAKYPDFSTTNAVVDGKLYGLPTGGNATAAFINTDIFEQAGVPLPTDAWTWDDLVSAANAIGSAELKTTDGAPIMGIDMRVQDIIGTYAGQKTEFGLYDWDGNLAVDAATIASWYDIELALQAGGGLPDASVVTTNSTLPTDQHPYALGQAGITIGYSNLLNGPYGLEGKSQILTPPTDTDKTGVALLPSAFWAVNAASEHPEEAAALMNWFLTNPEALALIKDTRGVPFNPDSAAIVAPLLEGPAKAAAEYVQATLDAGTVAPPQPAGGANMNKYSQDAEAEVLLGRMTSQEAAQVWVDNLTKDLAG